MTSHTIRLAQPSDAAAVCHLNRECMGYDYPLRAAAQKLQNLLADGRCRIFVAELDGQVVGYVHVQDYDVLYFDHMKNILGIAVDPAFRRQGIGRALLNAVEEWGKQSGACAVRLVSGMERTGAHLLYQHCGYLRSKEQLNMKKSLS